MSHTFLFVVVVRDIVGAMIWDELMYTPMNTTNWNDKQPKQERKNNRKIHKSQINKMGNRTISKKNSRKLNIAHRFFYWTKMHQQYKYHPHTYDQLFRPRPPSSTF